MQTDGQLFDVLHRGERTAPPPPGPAEPPLPVRPKERKGGLLSSIGRDELLILGIIFLITGDKDNVDIPLLLALIYVLMQK